MISIGDRTELPHLRHVVRHALPVWLPVIAVATVLIGVMYVVVQQDLRSGANDPQLEMAQDLAGRLATGDGATQVAAGPVVDLSRSLAPFVIVLDESNNVIASTGQLNGITPRPPEGVMKAAATERNVLTWQPRSDVRLAIVVQAWRSRTMSGTVIAGRSLREVEHREFELMLELAAGLVGVGLAATSASLVGSWIALGGPLWPYATRRRRSPID
jgi:hypothetical protein